MAAPLLSIVVVVHRMREQAMRTLFSLSRRYQRACAGLDYEVLVMENDSEEALVPAEVAALGPEFRYRLREDRSGTPVPALNEGAALARGRLLCLMVDGARMVTPGVVRHGCDAAGAAEHPLVVVPGYHLERRGRGSGADFSHTGSCDAEADRAALAAIDWPGDGYRLFEVAVWSGANRTGYLNPMIESNCLICRRRDFEAIGGADPAFGQPGGGMVNLDLYRRLGLYPGMRLIVLPGEGSFHQFHGGVTTRHDPGREALTAAFRARYEALRGESFQALRREPCLHGPVPGPALPWLHRAVELAMQRHAAVRTDGRPLWADEPGPRSASDHSLATTP